MHFVGKKLSQPQGVHGYAGIQCTFLLSFLGVGIIGTAIALRATGEWSSRRGENRTRRLQGCRRASWWRNL